MSSLIMHPNSRPACPKCGSRSTATMGIQSYLPDGRVEKTKKKCRKCGKAFVFKVVLCKKRGGA